MRLVPRQQVFHPQKTRKECQDRDYIEPRGKQRLLPAMPLRYFSGLHAQWWPTWGDLWYEGLEGGKVPTAVDRLDKLLSQSNAQYFVITLEQEYQQQKDLVELLKHYTELAVHPEGVRIFELKRH